MLQIPKTPAYADYVVPTSRGWLAILKDGRTELLSCRAGLLDLYSVTLNEVKPEQITVDVKREEPTKIDQTDSSEYTQEELLTLDMKDLRDIGDVYGVKGRAKDELISEILDAQQRDTQEETV